MLIHMMIIIITYLRMMLISILIMVLMITMTITLMITKEDHFLKESDLRLINSLLIYETYFYYLNPCLHFHFDLNPFVHFHSHHSNDTSSRCLDRQDTVGDIASPPNCKNIWGEIFSSNQPNILTYVKEKVDEKRRFQDSKL